MLAKVADLDWLAFVVVAVVEVEEDMEPVGSLGSA
ncbi:hypothetical protein M7I_3376 [Glarea lozoyensis 74030]|uniref:Uncharacterized protein n=1 Tax=Glarea lozoyensis (strain ATCC 74030 / MF5533) TaxID=1104152 RepID=H0ELB5_GLAL7|nr:hypothetical protein M7I_3376 [Glarea lozoyensis 74030]